MSGIKKDSVTVNHSVITDFTKDMGFYQVKMSVYSCVCPQVDGTHLHDITNIDFEFYIDGKRTRHSGLRGMYVKLFGDGSFAGLLHKLEQEVEETYYKTTNFPR